MNQLIILKFSLVLKIFFYSFVIMQRSNFFVSFLCLFIGSILPLYAQNYSDSKRVLLKDSLYQVKPNKSKDLIVLKFVGFREGIFYFRKPDQDSLIQLQSFEKAFLINQTIIKEEYPFVDQNTSKYLFGNPAYALAKGSLKLHTLFTGFGFEYGINRFWSIEVGSEVLSYTVKIPVYYAKTRFSFPLSKKLAIGFSYFYGNFYITSDFVNTIKIRSSYAASLVQEYTPPGLGMAEVYLTVGNTRNNFTGGIVWVNNFYDDRNNLILGLNLSTKIRLWPKWSLINENYILPSDFFENKSPRRLSGFIGLGLIARKLNFYFGFIYFPREVKDKNNITQLGNTLAPMVSFSFKLR